MPALAMTLSLLVQAAPSPAAAAPDMGWLSGYWLSCDRGREVSETWSGPRGGVLVGASLTTDARGEVSYELSRIGPSAKGHSFFAQPSGQAATEFPLTSSSRGRAVFENPAHDFPQRIIYTRVGERLTARIEGRMNDKPAAMEWRYTAAALNARCPAPKPQR